MLAKLVLPLLAGLAVVHAQLPPGLQMGGGGGDEVETHNAEELTDETFEERRMETELLVVYFRDGKDQQAKQGDKEIELAATELSGEDAAIHLGMVDLSEAKGAAKKAGITEGPNIAVWRRGKKLSLGPNGLDARSIVNFIRYLTDEVSTKLEGAAAVNEWLRKQEATAVLGIFADTKRPSHNTWVKVAETMRPPHRFAECSVADAQEAKLFAKEELDTTKNQFAVVRPHRWLGKDETPYVLGTNFNQMKTVVEEHQLTRVYPYSGAARAAMIKAGLSVVFVLLDTERMSKMFKYVVNRLHKLVAAEPEIASRFGFTILDTKTSARGLGRDFGIDASRDFAVAVYNYTSEQGYGTEALVNSSIDSFSALPLAPWLHRIAAGDETPFVRSEPEPTKPAGKGEVHVAVTTNLGSVVDDEAYDVLLGAYDAEPPSPTLGILAKVFENVPTLRVVSINSSANLLDRHRYMPYLLPRGKETRVFLAAGSAAGKASPVAFDEKRKARGDDVDSLDAAEFVLKHGVRLGEHADALAKVKADVRRQRKAKDKEAAERFPGLADAVGDKKKKKKKKKKGKGKGKAAKEEL